jgi:acetyl esterase/lipase
MAYVLLISLAVVGSLFALYITRKEKRSFRSWVSERLLLLRLKRGWFHASEDSDLFLEQQAIRNEDPYQMPTPLQLLAIISTVTYEDLYCIELRERRETNNRHIIYFHGGAYVEHPILPHWLFLDRINNQVKGVITIPIYPKAPVHTVQDSFDRMVDLCISIMRDRGSENTVFMGDSAGGGYALAVAQELLVRGNALPKEVILISPWLDITLRNAAIDTVESKDPMLNRHHLQRMGISWAGSMDLTDRRVSPINGPLTGLPPLTLFVGTHELFLPDARKFRMLCLRQGVRLDYFEYPKMNHDFPLFPIPEATRAVREIVEIIKRV